MRRTMLAALAAGLTIGGVLGGLFAAGAMGPDDGGVPSEMEVIEAAKTALLTGKPPPYKQTVEAEYAAERATDEAGYHAPKPTPDGPIPTRAQSCPIDESTLTKGVFEGAPYQLPPDPEMRTIHVVSEAFPTSADDGKLYSLYLGYPDTSPFFPERTADPEHGLIVVWGPGSRDPCAAREPPVLLDTASRLNRYPLPFTGTPARFTHMDGNSVTFEMVDGRTGRFNFITRTFEEPR